MGFDAFGNYTPDSEGPDSYNIPGIPDWGSMNPGRTGGITWGGTPGMSGVDTAQDTIMTGSAPQGGGYPDMFGGSRQGQLSSSAPSVIPPVNKTIMEPNRGTPGAYNYPVSTQTTQPQSRKFSLNELNAQFPIPQPQAMPTYVAPTFTAPVWDKEQIKRNASKFASPYISEMRKAIRDAIVRTSSTTSPVQRRYQLGGALEKAGEGYGQIMSQAAQQGRAEYQDEYGRLYDASKTNFAATQQGSMANYSAMVNDVTSTNAALRQQGLTLYNAALADFMRGT